jgi:hypothetical protein
VVELVETTIREVYSAYGKCYPEVMVERLYFGANVKFAEGALKIPKIKTL